MHNSTDLRLLLRERGTEFSASQVYRLLTQRPERVSLMMVVAALCDIFSCGPRRPGYRHGNRPKGTQDRLRRQRRGPEQDREAQTRPLDPR